MSCLRTSLYSRLSYGRQIFQSIDVRKNGNNQNQKTPKLLNQRSPPMKNTKLGKEFEGFNGDLLHNSKFGLL